MRRISFLILIFLLTVGCWDMLDIDQRSLVLGVALDVSEEDDDEYKMTIEVPIVAQIGAAEGRGGGQGRESAGGKAHVVTSTVGRTVAQMATNFEKRFWRRLFFGHLQVLVFSEKRAAKGIKDCVDFFDRSPSADRRVKLAIAEGEAGEIFQTKNPREPLVSVYLDRLLEIQKQSARVPTRNLQDSLKLLEAVGSAVVPRVRGTEDELVVGGAAVIKDWKFVGYLGENEARTVQFLYDNIQGGRLYAHIDGIFYTLDIQSSQTKLTPLLVNDQMTIKISINLTGDILEVMESTEITAQDLKIIEDRVAENLQKDLIATLGKLQKVFQADAIGFLELIKRRYPTYWRENRENWEDRAYQELAFAFQVEVIIRRTGVIQ